MSIGVILHGLGRNDIREHLEDLDGLLSDFLDSGEYEEAEEHLEAIRDLVR